MSSRWYPIYQRGNPQLRIFLPNFWMKLIRPEGKQPPNVVQFMVPTGMTNHDIRQYLEKIYNLTVVHVKSQIENGKRKEAYKYGFVVQEDHFRRAYVTLPRDQKFEFPNIETNVKKTEARKDDEKLQQEVSKTHDGFLSSANERPGIPNWYSF